MLTTQGMTAVETWPPNWRECAADAGEAKLIRSGIVLAELDELCDLFPGLASDARQLAGKLRSERGDLRDRVDAFRLAGKGAEK